MAGGLTVTGGAETGRAFDQLASDVVEMPDTHERIARARLSGVRSLTPVRSGALIGSWDASGKPGIGSILSPLAYAPSVEYGVQARGIPPVGMVRRTLEAESAAIVAEYEAAIRDRGRRRGFRVV